jgi:phosphoserine phosphatase
LIREIGEAMTTTNGQTTVDTALLLTAPSGGLNQIDVARVQNAMPRGSVTSTDWLAQGTACDIIGSFPSNALALAREAVRGQPIDVNQLPVSESQKRLLIADMDSTIITCECIDEIADFIGRKAEVSAITERAMQGELVFEDALRERVALFKGMPVKTLERVFADRVKLTSGARALVQTMRKSGALTVLVSGGFTFFTERVAKLAGFEIHQANTLLIEDDVLTGKVREPILGRAAKLDLLKKLMQERNLSAEQTVAIGDGANDLDMIKAAGLGVAFHAKPIVAEAADAVINHADLTAPLYLQGFFEDEIIRD